MRRGSWLLIAVVVLVGILFVALVVHAVEVRIRARAADPSEPVIVTAQQEPAVVVPPIQDWPEGVPKLLVKSWREVYNIVR